MRSKGWVIGVYWVDEIDFLFLYYATRERSHFSLLGQNDSIHCSALATNSVKWFEICSGREWEGGGGVGRRVFRSKQASTCRMHFGNRELSPSYWKEVIFFVVCGDLLFCGQRRGKGIPPKSPCEAMLCKRNGHIQIWPYLMPATCLLTWST